MTLEERVARLETRHELSDLVVRYCHLIDARDYAGAAELFDADATFAVPDERVTGREALQRFLRRQLGRYDSTFHYVHSQLIEQLEGEQALAVVDAHAEHAEDGACVVAGLRYVDSYHRAAEGWRFAARELRIRYFLPWRKMSDRYRTSSRFGS